MGAAYFGAEVDSRRLLLWTCKVAGGRGGDDFRSWILS